MFCSSDERDGEIALRLPKDLAEGSLEASPSSADVEVLVVAESRTVLLRGSRL